MNHSNTLSDNRRVALVAVVSAGVAVLVTYLSQHYFRKYQYWNSKFVKVGTIQTLQIFPVKSGKGKQVPYLDCNPKGSSHGENKDRYFIVVDILHDNLFLTARSYPRMVLIESNVENNRITVSIPDGKSVLVDLGKVVRDNHIRRAILHRGEHTDGYDCGEEVGQLLTEFLELKGKRDLRLLYFVDGIYTERDFPTKPEYWNNPVPKLKAEIAYADTAPYHAFTTASIDDLNGRLAGQGESIDLRNFRPNFVVSPLCPVPFDEDRWLNVKVGKEVEFVCFKPSYRCSLTTVNPDVGDKSIRMEPLRELRSYRMAPEGKLRNQYKESPVFGVHLALVKGGRIRVEDEVFVRYKPTPY